MTSPRPSLGGQPHTPRRSQHNGANGANGTNGTNGSPSGYTSLRDLVAPISPTSPRPALRDWNFARGVEEDMEGEQSRIELPELKEKRRLSLWRLIALTVSMGGSQIAWTVELGYGTPYLLDLGLSEDLTSLVWLAGPISGLVVQPLIGVISDSSTSRYRRRYWIVASTILLVISTLGLAFTEPVAKAIVDIFGGGQGDWDPRHGRLVKLTAISIAVFCFYSLDFALNGLQASLRNLVFDVTPEEQINAANALHARFLHLGSIVGFALGYIKLDSVPIIRLIGGEQFRKLCIVAMTLLVITVWITCFTIDEDPRSCLVPNTNRGKLRDMFYAIDQAIRTLPEPVRRICAVQFAAFGGWFTYLFYSTTYMQTVMSHEQGRNADRGEATRVGSFAMLLYAFVAITAGTVLPWFSQRDERLLPNDYDDDEAESARIRDTVDVWRRDAHRRGRPLKLPRMPFMLRDVWTCALVFFFVLMMSTFFISTVWQATTMIALVGICWAVAMWVPFAIMMEFLREIDADNDKDRRTAPPSPEVSSSPDETRLLVDHTLQNAYSAVDLEAAGIEYAPQGPVAGGTIMGIHNLAIVFPQFLIAIVASIIFKVVDGDLPPDHLEPEFRERTGVSWVLRFGGLAALVGAVLCRRVPPTRTEKAMRRRLAEMREEQEQGE
ncbi:hypothetical protein CcaverHIS002_0106960 [Cutaneotrichosporon cavernicola]|uniref:MFS general substrate transporter n=1 Tax=Cutaneotrichosporon cavernicola TaxID=279322 RepID=A0AA48I229_9TREE|nr:uncharacterized protein CcaverHIS019_0106900 [Cutaneotrichosporon cavernicola]BEI80167.1 hypothetical protein CcaverHIS002_0106960 [Cutaneotrichosporon cavernicola]BEI87972.1 hypothetical protein CcaverHIS019_0106900 [Cutaneotrichosporon cavernicola]BEI95746.1 hypothetical protein CcaverHIS631_0106950 [Cutaneotrichosporon cavernicola]